VILGADTKTGAGLEAGRADELASRLLKNADFG
jgi:hypothetical protein